jgi:hypothetical protein
MWGAASGAARSAAPETIARSGFAGHGRHTGRRRTMTATASENRWGHRATAAAAGGGGSNGSDGATTRLEVGSSSSRNGSAPGLGTQAGAESTPPPRELLPGHLAAIMDGNGRWAAARGLPPVFGYQAGIDALRTVIHCCLDWGVPCLTVRAYTCTCCSSSCPAPMSPLSASQPCSQMFLVSQHKHLQTARRVGSASNTVTAPPSTATRAATRRCTVSAWRTGGGQPSK